MLRLELEVWSERERHGMCAWRWRAWLGREEIGSGKTYMGAFRAILLGARQAIARSEG